jgi:methionine sulfoxide reductase heme-binding subunit
VSARTIRRIFKPLVFAASLAPIVLMFWDALDRQSDTIYFNGIVRSTGYWSLRFLCIALAITPVRWLTGWHSLVKFRRMMGLFGFSYGVAHAAAYVLFDRVAALDAAVRARLLDSAAKTVSAIGVDLLRPFFAIGFVALILIVPLAATSTAGMIRSMGGRRWQALHRLAYPAAVASVLHTYWPLTLHAPPYAVILVIVFVLRLGHAYAYRRADSAGMRSEEYAANSANPTN